MPSPWRPLGKPLGGRLWQGHRGARYRPRAVKFKTPAPNYQRIKEEVLAAIAQLSATDQAQIPATGTLPEIMVAYALIKLGFMFQSQHDELGGRIHLGGGVVDFKVMYGARILIIRVQGDYWHSMPERVLKDALQYDRLHRLGYRVADLWESDIYQAWVEGRLLRFVGDAINSAA